MHKSYLSITRDRKPYVVGISGGSCSGKTSTIENMITALHERLKCSASHSNASNVNVSSSFRPSIAIIDTKRFIFSSGGNGGGGSDTNGSLTSSASTSPSHTFTGARQQSVPIEKESDGKPQNGSEQLGSDKIESYKIKSHPHTDNPEHPAAINDHCLQNILEQILTAQISGQSSVILPTSPSEPYESTINLPVDILFVEGTLAFYFRKIRKLMDLRLFVNCDPDIRLARQVLRDTKQSRPLGDILEYYASSTKPAFEEFCLPTKKYAHIIIPRGCENDVAIDLIVQHLHEILMERSSDEPTSGEDDALENVKYAFSRSRVGSIPSRTSSDARYLCLFQDSSSTMTSNLDGEVSFGKDGVSSSHYKSNRITTKSCELCESDSCQHSRPH